MKKTLRNSLLTTAVATGIILSASGCASSPVAGKDADQSTPAASSSSVQPTAKKSSPAGGEKSVSFESPLRVEQTVPAPWAKGDGWSVAGVNQMVALPNHIAYVYSGTAKNTNGFAIYNGEGRVVADVKAPENVKLVTAHEAITVWQDGKMYVVDAVGGFTSDNQPVISLTSFDEDANKVASVVVKDASKESKFDGIHNAVLIRDMKREDESQIFDPATGKFTVLAEDTNDRRWLGRADGMDVYLEAGKVKTDKWEKPYDYVENAGKYLAASKSGNSACDILDPTTGEVIGGNEGACAAHVETGSDVSKNIPGSSVDGMILRKWTGSNKQQQVLYLSSEKKSYVVDPATNFEALSVDSSGVFYGTVKGVPTSIDVKNSGPLTTHSEVESAPAVITGNGIAAFTADGGTYYGRMNFLLPKG